MRNPFFIISIAAFAATISCSRQNESLQGQIDDLSVGRIATLEEQHDSIAVTLAALEKCDGAMTRYIEALSGSLDGIRADVASDSAALAALPQAIAAAEDAQDTLRKCISEVKEYMDSGIRSFRDWCSGTFATLEKHEAVCRTLAVMKAAMEHNATAIGSLHDDLVIECRALVKVEIKDMESSLKEWVNDKLTGYMTAARTQAKLDSLAAVGDGDVADLLAEFTAAKGELTVAYKKAIEEAIEKYDGELTVRLADEIDAFTLDAEEKLAVLEGRLSAVETAAASLLSSIQSIACVPAYNDGFAALDVAKSETVLKYKIMPLSAAEKLVALWKSVSDSTGITDTIFRVRSRETVTQSGSPAVTVTYLPVKKVSYGSGIVSVTVNHEVMSDAYWTGDVGAGASLVIDGGLDIKTSAYMPLRFTPTLEVAPADTFLRMREQIPVTVSIRPAALKEKIVWTTSDKQKATVVKRDTSRYVLGTERKGGVTVTATLTLLGKTYAKSFSMSVIPYYAVPGYFSVSATKKVTFAHGNLQYVGKTKSFNFASQQYTALKKNGGNDNTDTEGTRPTQSTPIDLYGWATSLSNESGVLPSSCNIYNSNYSTEDGGNLTYSNKADWGYDLNNDENARWKTYPYWRTLSLREWEYLIGNRPDAAKKVGFATVYYESGVILLPDEFTDPKVNTSSKATGKAFVPMATTGYDANEYSKDGWSKMEKAGAVFLPTTGYRTTYPIKLKCLDEGFYWTSTANGSSDAYELDFNDSGILNGPDSERRLGDAVRLVADQNDGKPQ